MKKIIIITAFLLGLCIGALIMSHELCKQKDSMIRYLMKNTAESPELVAVPKNLPLIKIK